MPRHRLLTATIAASAAALLLAACGGDSSSSTEGEASTRTVEVKMVDTAFEPNGLEVTKGETVRFRFTNDGSVTHEAIIGDGAAQADHEKEMRSKKHDDMGDMSMHGDESDAVSVEPGESGELTHTFDEAGNVEIGCHEVGHYDAGMKINIEVS